MESHPLKGLLDSVASVTLSDLDEIEPSGWVAALDQYLGELKALPPLSAAEEAEVARRAKAGDAEALERLVCANTRYVVSVAKGYRGRGLSLEDLIGEGNLGLLTAARKFDPERGHKFITYAVWWIRQAILAALAEQGRSVRLPLAQGTNLVRLTRATERLRKEFRREPTPEELAKETGLSQEIVRNLSAVSIPPVRLGTAQPDSDVRPEFDLPDEASDTAQPAMDAGRTEAIARALQGLSARDAKMLRLRYGLDGEEHTLEEIGGMFGVSRERVRQICAKALEKLRRNADLALEAGQEPVDEAIPIRALRITKRSGPPASQLPAA